MIFSPFLYILLGSSTHHFFQVEYFIKWKGYSKRHNSWQPSENLDCPDILAAFEKSQKNDDGLVSQKGDKIERQTKRKNAAVSSENFSDNEPTEKPTEVDEISEISINGKVRSNKSKQPSQLACQFQMLKEYSDLESDSECEPILENPRKKKKQSTKNDDEIESGTLKKYTTKQTLQRQKSESDEGTAEAPPKGMVSKPNYRNMCTLFNSTYLQVKNLTQKDVYKQFADGKINAQWFPDKSSDKYKLFKKIRRLTTISESGKKIVQNYFYCTKCGRIIYFNTQSHYNQLNRHYDNECSPQMIDQGESVWYSSRNIEIYFVLLLNITDKIVLSRIHFIDLIESVMKIAMEYGTADVGNVPIPKQWTEKNR